jgi:hypothetical protein
MKTIWKTTLTIVAVSQHVSLPKFAHPIHVGLDPSGAPCEWRTDDTDEQHEQRTNYNVGTGNPTPQLSIPYVGTFVLGAFVWHVFIPTGLG